jgi:(p)ppGpp synthase/HD superfamily hydrolase
MNLTLSHQLLKAVAFAADKHRFQTRKDSERTPYINHPIKVAMTLCEVGHESDTDLLIAAILHDTVEDTETTPEEIEREFGKFVRDIVMEVTDDKNLGNEERKRLQIVKAHLKSRPARKLKLADKICNVHDVIFHAPAGWSTERRLEYLRWAEQVLEGLVGVNHLLEKKLREGIVQGRQILTATEMQQNVA